MGGSLSILAQDSLARKKKAPNVRFQRGILIDFNYGYQFPLADMATNFKGNSNLGTRLQYITPHNIMIGGIAEFQFSDRINPELDVLSALREPTGGIIDKFGTLSDAELRQRGYFLGGSVAYIIKLGKKNPRSGLEVRLGAGYQRHWVDVNMLGSEMLQLTEGYVKGYDRLSEGLALQQYIGYRHLDRRTYLNFFIGIDCLQAFTKNSRGFNYDTGLVDDQNKFDVLLGAKVGLTLPIYIYGKDTENELFFY